MRFPRIVIQRWWCCQDLGVVGGVDHVEGVEEVGLVQGDAAEGNVKEELGERGADQDLEVLILGAVFVELLGGTLERDAEVECAAGEGEVRSDTEGIFSSSTLSGTSSKGRT